MNAVMNTVTALSLIAGLLVLVAIAAWLIATFGADWRVHHNAVVSHRRMLAEQAAQRADTQARTAGYLRAHRNPAGRAL